MVEWLRKGADAVEPEIATKRAAICATCINNGQGGLERYFTIAVSEAIRGELNRRNLMRLSTPYDDKLNVCEVCYCPLKLKVHLPLARVTNELAPDLKETLPPHCWIWPRPPAAIPGRGAPGPGPDTHRTRENLPGHRFYSAVGRCPGQCELHPFPAASSLPTREPQVSAWALWSSSFVSCSWNGRA